MRRDVPTVAVPFDLRIGCDIDCIAEVSPIKVRLQPLDCGGGLRDSRREGSIQATRRFEHDVSAGVEDDECVPVLVEGSWRFSIVDILFSIH